MPRKKIPIEPERTDVCKNCRASHYEDGEFECRRHPPVLLYEASQEAMVFLNPIVQPDHWCCEFLPILNS